MLTCFQWKPPLCYTGHPWFHLQRSSFAALLLHSQSPRRTLAAFEPFCQCRSLTCQAWRAPVGSRRQQQGSPVNPPTSSLPAYSQFSSGMPTPVLASLSFCGLKHLIHTFIINNIYVSLSRHLFSVHSGTLSQGLYMDVASLCILLYSFPAGSKHNYYINRGGKRNKTPFLTGQMHKAMFLPRFS